MRTGAVTAIGARHLARRGQPDPRPRRQPGHCLLERPAARPAVRLRGDPRPLAAPREPRRRSPSASPPIWARRCGSPPTGARASRGPTSSSRRRGCRARAAPRDGLDRAWGARHPLRNGERGRARPDGDHGQGRRRRLGTGRRPARSAPCAPRRPGALTPESLHAELGEIVVGVRPGREADAETILFWHRGLSLSDIALAHALLQGGRAGVGTRLRVRVATRLPRVEARRGDLVEQQLGRRRDRDRDERADDARAARRRAPSRPPSRARARRPSAP